VHGTPAKLVIGDRDRENVAATGKPWSAPGYVVYAGEQLVVSSLPAASRVTTLEASDFYENEDQDGQLSWEKTERRKRNYFVSWALVHMLLHERHAYAIEVQQALLAAPGTRGTAGKQIQQIVEGVPSERLDDDFARYLVKPGRVAQRQEPPAEVPSELEVRSLSEAEILGLWALLAPLRGVRQEPRSPMY
jgi:hypothetical protein